MEALAGGTVGGRGTPTPPASSMASLVNRRTVSAEDFFFFFWSLPSALIDTRLPNCTARFHIGCRLAGCTIQL